MIDGDPLGRSAHRQSLAVANSAHAKADQDFVDTIAFVFLGLSETAAPAD
jgi:hypothetical protein